MRLVEAFRSFHAEFLDLVRELESAAPGSETGRADTVLTRLTQALAHRERALALREHPSELTRYRVAEFVMCGLVDDVLLCETEWPGRDAWAGALIETARFETRVAGDKVFALLDALLAYKPVRDLELAEIFLLALSAGFEGRYRGGDGGGELRRYREALADALGRPPPGPVCLEAYTPAARAAAPVKLPDLRRWALGLVAMGLVYLVLSEWVWRASTADLVATLDAIKAEEAPGP